MLPEHQRAKLSSEEIDYFRNYSELLARHMEAEGMDLTQVGALGLCRGGYFRRWQRWRWCCCYVNRPIIVLTIITIDHRHDAHRRASGRRNKTRLQCKP